jgi:hypothetical protein
MMRRTILTCLIMLLLSSALIGISSNAKTRSGIRQDAEARWQTHMPKNYRLAVRIERLARRCFQELEVREGMPLTVLRDTCSPSWLSNITVPRLFELSQRLEQAPECLPSSSDCVCRRVRIGQIEYDEQLGFPRSIYWRRENQSNWQHLHYWQDIWDRRTLPTCGANTQFIRITVVSLTPIM